jgi:hypothetical protein
MGMNHFFRLFHCKIFLDENDFRENDFFFFFSGLVAFRKNASENILQYCTKDRSEEAGWGVHFWKMVYEKIGRKQFSKF